MTTDFTSKPLVCPTDDSLSAETHSYSTDAGPLPFELHRSAGKSGPLGAVLIVSGFPDPGMTAMVGKPLKDWASYIGWSRLIAAAGLIGVRYLNREPADVFSLVRHLRANGEALGIDPERTAVFACSGNVPTALSLLAGEKLARGAFLYGFMLDDEGETAVADAATRFHFAPATVRSSELSPDAPMLIVRAGADATPGLLPLLDRFIAAKRDRLAITVLDLPGAPHAFDVLDDSAASRAAIEQIVAFLREV